VGRAGVDLAHKRCSGIDSCSGSVWRELGTAVRGQSDKTESWEGASLDTKLSERIQSALDALIAAESEAAHVTAAMRRQSVSFGLEYSHVEDDIARIVTMLYYMKYLAERQESEQPRAVATKHGTTVDKPTPASGAWSNGRTTGARRS
jgi:hypothetical protein